jgi:hypothetical protein
MVVLPDSGSTSATVALRVAPTLLTGTVGADDWLGGYNERRARGVGTFISRADIDRKAPVVIGDILRDVPGLRLGTDGELCARGSAATPRSRCGCTFNVFIDGQAFPNATAEELNAFLNPDRVGAVEVYTTRAQVPRQFVVQSRADVCATVVLWSRAPR